MGCSSESFSTTSVSRVASVVLRAGPRLTDDNGLNMTSPSTKAMSMLPSGYHLSLRPQFRSDNVTQVCGESESGHGKLNTLRLKAEKGNVKRQTNRSGLELHIPGGPHPAPQIVHKHLLQWYGISVNLSINSTHSPSLGLLTKHLGFVRFRTIPTSVRLNWPANFLDRLLIFHHVLGKRSGPS